MHLILTTMGISKRISQQKKSPKNNFAKDMKDSYNKNYETPMKEYEDTKRWKTLLFHRLKELLLLMSILPKQLYIFSTILIKYQ
jgi:hypothetical protein